MADILLVDFLFACGQALCLAALLYGAYIVIRYGETFAPPDKPRQRNAAAPRAAFEFPYWRDDIKYHL